ncbi:PAP-associated domain-containing protein 5-like, partial [Trifolium pratense]
MEVDQENLQIPETILYTTLSPLPLTADDPPDSNNHEQYSVFRNEISLDTPQVDSVYSTAPDFFSLDVADEAEAPLPEPITTAEPKTPAIEHEPTLEGGWFRGNGKFRSPMLQLHKEIVDFCEFLSPTPEEKAKRDAAIESVFEVIKHIWPHCQ